MKDIKKTLKSNYLKIALSILFIVVLFMFARKAAAYTIFCTVCGTIVYYSKLYHFPIDVSPLFLFEVAITKYYGILYTLLFIFIAYVIPKTLAGSGMKWDSYVFIAIGLVANMLVFIFPNMKLLYIGFISSIILYVLGALFSATVKPLLVALGDGVANIVNNLIWFLIFSDAVVWLIGQAA